MELRSLLAGVGLAIWIAADIAGAEPGLRLRIEAEPPVVFAYRNAFGETEPHLVVTYRVRNPTTRVLRHHGVPVAIAAADGRALNDGFRPLVQDAFCREVGCAAGTRSTAELQGVLVPPRGTVVALAIFPIFSEGPPAALRVSAGDGSPVALRRTDAGYRIVRAGRPPRAATSEAPKRATSTTVTAQPVVATRPDEGPRSWRVVQSAIPQQGGNAR